MCLSRWHASASAPKPVSFASAQEPPSPAPAPPPSPEPWRSKRRLSIPGHHAVLAGRSPRKTSEFCQKLAVTVVAGHCCPRGAPSCAQGRLINEMHAREVYAYEMHARKVHAYETHAH